MKYAFYASKDCKEKGEEIKSMTIANVELSVTQGMLCNAGSQLEEALLNKYKGLLLCLMSP